MVEVVLFILFEMMVGAGEFALDENHAYTSFPRVAGGGSGATVSLSFLSY